MDRVFLVVDDDALTADMIASAATRRGFHALTAQSADEADLVLEQNRVDVIVTDVDLRGPRTGIGASVGWVERNPDITVIVMSGHIPEMIADFDEFPENGHFIQKPFTFRQLEALLDVADDPA